MLPCCWFHFLIVGSCGCPCPYAQHPSFFCQHTQHPCPAHTPPSTDMRHSLHLSIGAAPAVLPASRLRHQRRLQRLASHRQQRPRHRAQCRRQEQGPVSLLPAARARGACACAAAAALAAGWAAEQRLERGMHLAGRPAGAMIVPAAAGLQLFKV